MPKQEKTNGWIKRKWNELDENFIMPYIIHNYPNSVSEHGELATKIRTVYKDYHKVKRHEHPNSDNNSAIELENLKREIDIDNKLN